MEDYEKKALIDLIILVSKSLPPNYAKKAEKILQDLENGDMMKSITDSMTEEE